MFYALAVEERGNGGVCALLGGRGHVCAVPPPFLSFVVAVVVVVIVVDVAVGGGGVFPAGTKSK